jgi:hypothetical protein
LTNTHSFKNLTRINTKQKQAAPLSKNFSAVGVGSSSPLGPFSSRSLGKLETSNDLEQNQRSYSADE